MCYLFLKSGNNETDMHKIVKKTCFWQFSRALKQIITPCVVQHTKKKEKLIQFIYYFVFLLLISLMSLLNLTSKKKKKEISDQNVKLTSGLSDLSIRTISRMGHSASTLLPQKSSEDKTNVQKIPLNNVRILQPQWDVAQDNLLLDVVEVQKALDLFLNSQISQAESILQPKRSSSLYHSLGYAFIMFLKSVMTFQQTDIEMAIESLKETIQLANGFRKKDSSWVGSITAWVKGITVQDIKNMSLLHRHAVSQQ